MLEDASEVKRMPGGMRIRPLERADVDPIREIVLSSGNFNPEEVRTAIELLEEFLAKGEPSEYIVAVFESGDKIQGYVCYGPTPLTDGVYDLYWMATDAVT